MKGITTILDEKKWVFSYFMTGLCRYTLDDAGFIQVMVILVPFVFALAGVDKYTKRKTESQP